MLQDLEQQWKSKRAALVKDVTGGGQGRPDGSCAVSSIAHPSLEKQFTVSLAFLTYPLSCTHTHAAVKDNRLFWVQCVSLVTYPVE